MGKLDDINAMLAVAAETFSKIQQEYETSLHGKTINPKLSVYIKNYFENLRSPLDYAATDICDKILGLSKSHKTYFPVSCKTNSEFTGHMNRNFPGLGISNPLYIILEQLQPYNSIGKQSLPRLSKLVNQNKHNQLSPQTRSETKSLTIQFPGGASIQMGHGASISGGGIISSGGGWISPANGTISSENPVSVGQGINQTVTIWVSFTFDETGDEVISFLRLCKLDVESIINQLQPILWPK